MLMSGDGLWLEIGSVPFQSAVTLDVEYGYPFLVVSLSVSCWFGTGNWDGGTGEMLISGAAWDIGVATVIGAGGLRTRGATLGSRLCFLLGVL